MFACFLFVVWFCFVSCFLRQPSAVSVPVVPVFPSCSLEVRAAVVPSSCCLLLSRSGVPLRGAALSARRGRLVRLGVLLP